MSGYSINFLHFLRLAALMCCLALGFGGQAAAQQYTLRIGVIGAADSPLLRGAQLAAQRVNAAGGISGADGAVFNLAVVDTPPNNIEIAIANMRQAHVIAVLLPDSAALLAENLPALQALDVPVFTPATADTALLADSSNRIFRSRAAANLQTRALADYLVNTLAIRSIQSIQLDAQSTAELVGLANALAGSGIRLVNHLYDGQRGNLDSIAQAVVTAAPAAVALYGPPSLAAQAYNRLQAAGYEGALVYNQASDSAFVELSPPAALDGIIGSSNWSFALLDAASVDFTLAYARAFGQLPTAISAASFDAVLLAASIQYRAGGVSDALRGLDGFIGLQGPLNPAELQPGEISENVIVTSLNQYGSPRVVARYAGGRALTLDEAPNSVASPTPQPSPTPAPTATLSGYNLRITSPLQNVRGGPGLQYEILGELSAGTQARVLGANADYSWLVIDFNGQWGWLAAFLVEARGNRNLLPIIQPPASPTPPPTATNAPSLEPDLVVLHAGPPRLVLGQPVTVNITVLNQGLSAAGPFAIAASFQPGDSYAGLNLPALGSGEQITSQLQQTLNGPSGPQSVIIVVDLNEQVAEGNRGEANNRVYSYNYIADRAILTSGTWTIAAGSIDLDGSGNPDFTWSGGELVALGAASMYLLPNFSSIEDLHYDAIDPTLATSKSFSAEALPNAMLGIVTAAGNRGVLQISSVARNGPLAFEYRIYQ